MSGASDYRWVNALGRWPGARFAGVRTDGERLALAPGTASLEPVAVADPAPAGGPLGMVVLADGTVLVTDPGHGRVLRVDGCDHTVCVLGCLDVATGDPAALREPRGLWLLDGGRLLVVDDAPQGLRAPDGSRRAECRPVGMVVRADTGEYLAPWTDPPPAEDPALRAARERVGGLAAVRVSDGVLVAGGARQVPGAGVVFVPDGGGDVVLLAAGYLAGIAVDRCGRVFVAGPGGIARLGPRLIGARGVAVVPAPREPVGVEHWDRVRVVLAEPAPAGTHVRVWTMLATDAAGTPDPPDPTHADADDAPVPTARGRWRAGPLDGLDVRVLAGPARPGDRLWITIELLGDGRSTPRVDDIRVERLGRGLLDALPAAYTGDDDGSGTLGRLLGLFGSAHAASVRGLDDLPASLDPGSAPDRPDDPWLDRLAGWVDAVPLTAADDAARRANVAGAYAAHGRRGTPAGLIEAVARETGVAVRVVEPLLRAQVWRLGTGGLGRDTSTRVADPGPPALDTTAVLDGADLVPAHDRGLPLYAAYAHRVCVHVPPERADALPEIARVVERERPAHVFAQVRLARQGVIPGQVGIDTVVAGPPPAWTAGAGPELGADVRLPGSPAAHVGGPVETRLDTTLPTPGGRGATPVRLQGVEHT
ncbi:phage tail protein [Embleya sp. NPDC020630]|uniref:phage tail protein n=1 Tax=Embleya sp. NPDC020630 TaxID=3363979 RepID=UPI003787DCC1